MAETILEVANVVAGPLGAAYAICGVMGWGSDLKSPRFRAVWIAVMGIGMVIALTGVNPIQIILLGGIVKKGYHCAVAINGRSLLDTLNIDKAFMGTNALSLKQGACVADIMLAETKRAMVEHANQVIVVCDHSKLSNTSLAQFASPAQIDTLVLDRLPEDAQAYQDAGIALLSVG